MVAPSPPVAPPVDPPGVAVLAVEVVLLVVRVVRRGGEGPALYCAIVDAMDEDDLLDREIVTGFGFEQHLLRLGQIDVAAGTFILECRTRFIDYDEQVTKI